MQQALNKKWWFTPFILLLIVILLHVLALWPWFIENVYSAYVYPPIAYLLRLLTGWLPFSTGDALYALVAIWLIVKIILFFRYKPSWKKFGMALRNLAVKGLGAYIFFLLLWALNYYRYGIGYKMHLFPDRYSTEDLKTVTAQIREQLNASRKRIDSLHIRYGDDKTIFKEAADLYDAAKATYPYLSYPNHSVKKMLAGDIGSYGGFLGYYNPFTGEAQVNAKAPVFVLPFIACHEIGHQLGFASESEASFAGFLAVRSGNLPAFNYSAYFDMFLYANGELYSRDSIAARENVKLLDTLVKKDINTYRQYLYAYRNPLEPLLTKLYGNYLKAHNQPKGIESYDEIVAWLIAYYKKYGRL
ncbi:DUF3810 domain-containing protein [Parafilimonas sp.]|uniref:DUF3810 domain-containing protein n=1 Tax=Parafilimonas sp. TaxID=1969739 RepID=UPI0039E686C5